MIERQRTKIKS